MLRRINVLYQGLIENINNIRKLWNKKSQTNPSASCFKNLHNMSMVSPSIIPPLPLPSFIIVAKRKGTGKNQTLVAARMGTELSSMRMVRLAQLQVQLGASAMCPKSC